MKKLILIPLLMVPFVSTNAKEIPFATVTKCINGYEWLFTYTKDKESKYVTVLDAERVYENPEFAGPKSPPKIKECDYRGFKEV